MFIKRSDLAFYVGIVVALIAVWIGLSATRLTIIVCVAQLALFLIDMQFRADHEIAVVRVLRSCTSGSILYLAFYFFGVIFTPQIELAVQVFLPLVYMGVMKLTPYLILGIVIGFLTVCAKTEAWFKRK